MYADEPSRFLAYVPGTPLVNNQNPYWVYASLSNAAWWFPRWHTYWARTVDYICLLLSLVLASMLMVCTQWNGKLDVLWVSPRRWQRGVGLVELGIYALRLYFDALRLLAHRITYIIIFCSFWYIRLLLVFLHAAFMAVRYWLYRRYGDLRDGYTHTTHRIRDPFRKLKLAVPEYYDAPHHGHIKAAIGRSTADDTINDFASDHKYTIYSVQKSRRDVKFGLRGSLDRRFPIDTHSRGVSTDPIPKKPMFKMMNVDYYLDFLEYLWMDAPFFMYTFTPPTPVGESDEFKWTVINNEIHMEVTGGATYQHQLWDWSPDHITAQYPGFGIIYNVDTIRVATCWSVILLTPKHRYYSDVLVPSMTLKRRQLSRIEHTFMTRSQLLPPVETIVMYSSPSSHTLMLAAPGEYTSIEISAEVSNVLRARGLHDNMRPQDIHTRLSNVYGKASNFVSELIYTRFPLDRVMLPGDLTPLKLEAKDVNYHATPLPSDGPDPKTRDIAKIIGPTIIVGACAPALSRANDSWTIKQRVQDTSTQKPLPEEWLPFIDEFTRMIAPVRIAPIELPEIESRAMDEAKRKRISEASALFPSVQGSNSVEIRSNQKKESYAAQKPPRNISTVHDKHYLNLSRFTLPLAALIKEQKWYVFGKHPDVVAERIYECVAPSKVAIETDYSRFDGTHSHACYLIEERIMLAAFDEKYHLDIRDIYSQMRAARANTSYGIYYELLGTRISGSADTSIGNTNINAVINFIDARINGMTPFQAKWHLGAYGGDDGVTPDPFPTIEHTAAQIGLRLRMTERKAGQHITMLARVYPNAWATPRHMADVRRVLSRYHLSVRPKEASNFQELVDRATGHLVTDPNTPLLSNLSRCVLRINDGKMAGAPDSYSVKQYEGKNTYTVDFLGEQPLCCELLGCTTQELKDYIQLVEDVDTYVKFIALPQLSPVKAVPPPEPGTTQSGIVQDPTDDKRAAKIERLDPKNFEIIASTNYSPPESTFADLRKYYARIPKLPGVRRFVDATAGFGVDFALVHPLVDCPTFAIEQDPDHYPLLCRNLTTYQHRKEHAVSIIFGDSVKFGFVKGDVVFLDPVWDRNRKSLRYGGVDVCDTIVKIITLESYVILRTPVQWVLPKTLIDLYTTRKKPEPFRVTVNGKQVFKMYTFGPPG
jgi:hypothetical protein